MSSVQPLLSGAPAGVTLGVARLCGPTNEGDSKPFTPGGFLFTPEFVVEKILVNI